MTWFSDICRCKCSFSDIGVVLTSPMCCFTVYTEPCSSGIKAVARTSDCWTEKRWATQQIMEYVSWRSYLKQEV